MQKPNLAHRLLLLLAGVTLLLPFSCESPVKKDKSSKTPVGRMLCASNAAHGIKTNGEFKEMAPYYEGAGFTSPPTSIQGGPENINACLIGRNKDGILIAFRGTLPPAESTIGSFRDWINSVFFAPPDTVEGFKGKVHRGFWRGLESIWEPIVTEVKKQMKEAGDDTPLFITGLSKGGAMAMLAAIRLEEKEGISVEKVFAFGAPRAADSEFAEAYSEKIKIVAYENHLDIVPNLPPRPIFLGQLNNLPVIGDVFMVAEKWDYADMGQIRILDKKGEIDDMTALMPAFRTIDLIMALKNGKDGIKGILESHKLDCSGRYFRLLAPDIECGEGG